MESKIYSVDERLKLLYSLLSGGKEIPENFFVEVYYKNSTEIVKVRLINNSLMQVTEGKMIGFVIDVRDVKLWFPKL